MERNKLKNLLLEQPVKTKGFLKDPISSKGDLLIAKLKVTKEYAISKKSSIFMQKITFYFGNEKKFKYLQY